MKLNKLLFWLVWLFFVPAYSQDDTDVYQINWRFQSYWTDNEHYYELAIPDGPGDPRFFVQPYDQAGFFRAQITTAFEKHPSLRWGMGGLSEEKRHYNHDPYSELYLTAWHDRTYQINNQLLLKTELEYRFYLKPWSTMEFLAREVSLNYQLGKASIGPILIGQAGRDNYLGAGFQVGYREIGPLSIQGAYFLYSINDGPSYRIVASLDF